jgi:DNA-binding MarR family transcriptional regulator
MPPQERTRASTLAHARGYRHAIGTRPVRRRSNASARHGAGDTDVDYARLLELHTGLRRFLHWSDESARDVGLTASQHQLLLAVKGHQDRRGPSIGDLAGYLMLRHHSAVGLVDRAVAGGLVVRHEDPDDLRVVRIRLTPKGSRILERLAASHLEELRRLMVPRLRPLWEGLGPGT